MFIDKGQISVLEPLAPLLGAKPRGVLLGVPQQILQAPAEAPKMQMDDERLRSSALEFGLGSIAALLGIVLIWLAARGVPRPLLRLAAMLEDIASAIFIRQSPDYSGLRRFWGLVNSPSPHVSPHPGLSITFRPAAGFSVNAP